MIRSNRRHRRKKNAGRGGIILFILILFLAAGILTAYLFKVNLSTVSERISSIFSKPTEPQSTTLPESTSVPDPIYHPDDAVAIPMLEPSVVSSNTSFSVDGTPYKHSAYYLFGNKEYLCVKLSELADFLGTRMVYDSESGTFSFSYREKTATFSQNTKSFLVDGNTVSLSFAVVPFDAGRDLYIPLEKVLSAFYPAHFADEEGNINFSDFSNNFPLQSDRDIPIISYYSVTDDLEMEQYLVPSESVFPSDFSDQLQFIVENGYSALRFEDLANLSNITNPVMLTFDGCWEDLYTVVFPLVQQYNIPINIFVWPDYLDTAGHITKEQLKELADSALVSVQAGSEIYTAFDSMSPEEISTRVLKAKSYVSGLIGREPLAFSYPAPGASTAAREFCASEFRFCLTRYGERPYNTTIDDGSFIYRYAIARGTPVAMLSYWLSKAN